MDKRDGRNIFVPEELSLGVMYFKENGRLDELMEFLAGYVRVVHAKRYYKSLLIKNCGSSYLDIITASDVAYIVSLFNNNDKVWLNMKTADGELVKPQYSSGKGIKRVYGVTTWNRSGMKYYRDVLKTWKEAFTRNTQAFKVLRRHWEKWIKDKDGGKKFMLNDGNMKKSAYSLLATRTEEDICEADDDDNDDNDDHAEFEYESDPEENTIILSNWDRKRGGRGECDNYNDSDDDDIGGDGVACSGNDVDNSNSGDSGDEDSSINNGRMNSHDEDDVEESSDDYEGTNGKRKRSLQQSQTAGDNTRNNLRRNRGKSR